jgi:NAD(P)-dependent dehydrogenase (short-subunit alcohol dehydrogenase family)
MGVLDGKVDIVTGAGQGVGRGIALALAKDGARVALLGRTVSKCETVAAEIAAVGGEGLPIACDVEHRDQIEASVARVVDEWGRIDVLVNNAQAMTYMSIRKLTDDDMESMWRSGPLACFRLMQACFPYLRDSKGSVINMGSGSSLLPHPMMSGYAMAKDAVSNGVKLVWTDIGQGRYRVRRATGPTAADFSAGFQIIVTGTQFVDAGVLGSSQSYYYKVDEGGI